MDAIVQMKYLKYRSQTSSLNIIFYFEQYEVMVKFLSTFYLFSLHAVLWNRWCYYYYETTSQLDNVKCVNASLY